MAQTRKTAEARREEVARAALRITGERGVTALTTSTLAAEVGVTTGALFRHFPTFEAILDATVVHAVEQVERTFPDPSGPPLERLIDLASRRIELLSAEPGIAWMLHSEQALLSLPPRAVETLRGLARRSRAFMVEALRDGAADGTIRRDIDPEVLVVPVIGTIHTLAATAGPRPIGRRARARDLGAVLDALKQMLSPPPSPDQTISNHHPDETTK